MKKNIFIMAIAFMAFACSETQTENTEAETVTEEEVIEITEPTLDVDKEIETIDALRATIESSVADITPVELPTEGMRAQIAQKWNKIHFYTENGQVIRIKTYPHDAISKRTEEFYLQDGELRLAIIEDDGEGERGKNMEEINKAYYFTNGELIKEINNTEESETAIRNSDGERLIQECNEYLSAYSENK
jgi:hypothetical protein